MKYLKIKDKKRRKNFFKKELILLKFKFLFFQKILNFTFHQKLLYRFICFYKKDFFVSINNRCIKTNNSRSVLKTFRISRIEFKRLVGFGKINGCKKSSW